MTSYDKGNEDRGGDFAFDTFRINLSGSIDDVSLNAELRIFDYMTAVKYAYVGYQLTDDWQVQAGITQVPPYRPYHAATDAIACAELLLAQIHHRFNADTPVGELWR